MGEARIGQKNKIAPLGQAWNPAVSASTLPIRAASVREPPKPLHQIDEPTAHDAIEIGKWDLAR